MNNEARFEVSIPHPRGHALARPQELAPTTEPFARPKWIPSHGHAPRPAGVHFDALRVYGRPGEEVMAALMNRQGWGTGPVIHAATLGETTFLVPPGSARLRSWPDDAHLRVLAADDGSFVTVPALNGATWPLLWRSIPTARAPFVDAAVLHEEVAAHLGDTHRSR